MNILYLSADRGIPIRGHKGAAVHVRALANAFATAGHAVTILTPRPGPVDGPAPQATIVECPLPFLPGTAEDGANRVERQAQLYTPSLMATALDWLAQHPCDVIYERYSLWSDVGARLWAATGLPLVLEVNAPLRQEAERHRHLSDDALAARIEATQFAAADFLAVVSEPLAHYVIGRGANPAKVHVLPNGVDPQEFHPAVRGGDVRAQYGLHGRIVVGFAGRMRPWHDGPTLLRAFARLHAANPAYHLLLVGEMSTELLAEIEAMGLATAVTITGPIPHNAVPSHLAAMDIAVSSHAPANGEPFYFSPLKLFEYLACGVPTVAANVGQPGHLIQPGHNGLLYPPGDEVALALAIQHLADNPAQAREMAWNGAEMVLRHYTWAQNANRVLSWLANGALPSSSPPDPPGANVSLPVLDGKLRQRLYRATRTDLAAPLLARQMAFFNKSGAYRLERIEQVEILKYKPGRRCVLAYELYGRHCQTNQPVNRRVIGKLFRDERGKRLYHLQKTLYEHGFGADATDDIHVPEALAYVPEMRMLVQASAPGQTLDTLSLRQAIDWQVKHCALGLAKLHRSGPGLSNFGFCRGQNGSAKTGESLRLKPYTLADELRGLADYTTRLAETRPGDMLSVEALHAALQTWAETLPDAPTAVPLHRDFYYSQVLCDGPHLTLIDFDLMALGDPAIDVANFTAHLAYLGLEQSGDLYRFSGETDTFLTTYLKAFAQNATFVERVAFYQAATLYRLLSVIAPRPTVRHLFPALLAHTQAALAGKLVSL